MIRKFAVSSALLDDPVGFRELTSLEKVAHRHTFAYEPREGFLYVRSRAISSRTNDNFDTFPADELKKSWATFVGKPVFVNHHNEDHKRMRGVIIDAALHEDTGPDGTEDTWVEVLMEVDAVKFPLLAEAVVRRDIERTSMGCDVIESECSVCANVARTPSQYCAHVARMKGQRVRRKNEKTGEMEDVLVHEICRGLSFFENSLLVEDPADPTAFVYGVDDRGLAMMARSKSKDVELEDHQKDRFKGVTVKKDSKGYFVQTHRARSKSYDTIDKIPDSAIKFIESTGSKTADRLNDGVRKMDSNDGYSVNKGYYGLVEPGEVAWSVEYVQFKSDANQIWALRDAITAEVAKQTGAKPFGQDATPEQKSLTEAVWPGWIGDDHRARMSVKSDGNGGWIFREYDWGAWSFTIGSNGRVSKIATEDKRVPGNVETLRMHECPVCSSEGRWNSDGRCAVCGYLPAPKPFQEPNTDVAGRVDRDGGWFDPDLTEATPFEAPDPSQQKTEDPSPVQPGLPTTKGQKVALSQGDIPMTTNNLAMAARKRQASAQPSTQRLVEENAALRNRIAQLTKRADEENPAQPVPEPATTSPAESHEETVAEPEAQNVDVETPGGVIADPIKAPGDVETIGGEAQDEILAGTNQTDNVEAPVAGTTEVDPAAVIDVQPDHRGETLGEPAFTGDWINPGADTVPDIGGNAAGGGSVESSRAFKAALGRRNAETRDRIWASIRLARLRLQAGIEKGDELELARRIEASSDSMEAIVREASTIQTLAQRQPQQRTAPRTARRAPSLASDRPAVVGGLASRSGGDDEALFE